MNKAFPNLQSQIDYVKYSYLARRNHKKEVKPVNKYYYKGMKISINDNNGKIRLIVKTKCDSGPIYKSYYHTPVDKRFDNRKKMVDFINEYINNIMLHK